MEIRNSNLGSYIIPEDVKNGICVDIGANVGSFIKKYFNYFKEIYYFEPIIECFNICQNFSQKHNNIHGYNKAVWGESNESLDIILHKNKDSGSCSIDSFLLNNDWDKKSIQKVESISLDDIYDLVGDDIDYCKCDCENNEYFIFLNKDLKRIKYIGVELHWQMGLKRYNELVSYILRSHNIVSGGINFDNMNKEVLFKLR